MANEKILVVDDDVNICELLRLYLTKELDHDLRRDVRPDREEADRALRHRAAGEELQPAI